MVRGEFPSVRNWDDRYASRASRMSASEIRELLKLLDQPDIISFAGGIPDPALFPHAEIARAYQRILSNGGDADAALQYGVSEGYLPLRQWLAGYMATLGVACTADNVLITNGAQQGLDFIAKLFINSGDKVLTARPAFAGALQAFNAYEPVFDVMPGPENNRTLESYAEGARPRLGYAMPDFANPTGTSMTLAERLALLDFAHAQDMPLIEDAAYEKLRYDGEAVPPLLALDAKRCGGVDKGLVLYCGTFSKTIVPGLRLGWIVAPRPVFEKLVLIKQSSDLHCSPLNQMVMHEVASQTLVSRIPAICATYRARRDAMLDALARHMPPGVSWTRPQGGMFIWLTLPADVDAAELLTRSLATMRVAFVPGRPFFTDGSGRNTLRLNFTLASPATIEEGIGRFGRLLAC